MKVYKSILVFLFFIVLKSYSQTFIIDSLNNELSLETQDSIKFKLIHSKIIEFRKINYLDSSLFLNKKLYKIALKTKDFNQVSIAYKTEFKTLNNKQDYKKAKEVYFNYIKFLELNKDTLQLGEAYYNLGANEHQLGNSSGSLEYFFKSSIYLELKGDPIKSYRALAIVYGNLNDLTKAYEFNEKVIELANFNKDYSSLARAYLSKGYQEKEMGKYLESIKSSLESENIFVNKLNDPTNARLSLIYGNIAEVYLYFHKNAIDSLRFLNFEFSTFNDLPKVVLDTVEFYLNKSLLISNDKGTKYHKFNAKTRIADYYFYRGQLSKALSVYLDCYSICKGESNMLTNEMNATSKLFKVYKKMGIYDKGLKYFELNVKLQDSLLNEDKQREVGRQEAKFEFEKVKAEEEVQRAKQKIIEAVKLEQEKAVAKEQEKNQRIVTYSIALGLVLISIFSLIIFKRLKVAKAQQVLIEKQKKTIEKNRNQMLESIEYSKNIQQRIFPTIDEVKALLPQSFLYFRPKDVVSGDFYWVHRKGNKTFFSVADCTGHGVPGAFMTLISLNLINAIILEDDVDSTSKILERLHTKLRERLTSSEEEQMKHGLDIAMCAINHNTNELEYSGLHNPIYIINKDNELKEIKGDNLFLGISSNFNVTKHIIPISSGDSVYLSTDGYPDQKGGEKGKKYYYSRLRNSLRIVDTKPLNERSLILNQKFNDWKGDEEQIDDVCIMGVGF